MSEELGKVLGMYRKGKLSDEEFDLLVEIITSDIINDSLENNKEENHG
ncbi:hypothetical protein KAR04_00305 [Candidatus Calescamantes bacterium]|nr:hypothetical protein [Candidatus Calescamantes bacterium]MCK5599782.1 hypothetical protein [bacterium]